MQDVNWDAFVSREVVTDDFDVAAAAEQNISINYFSSFINLFLFLLSILIINFTPVIPQIHKNKIINIIESHYYRIVRFVCYKNKTKNKTIVFI